MSGFTNYRSGCDLPKSFAEAEALLDQRKRRKLANNTWLEHNVRGGISIVLHETAIVTYHRDGSTTLDSGGWQTATTRDRLCRCGFACFTAAGIASIDHHGTRWVFRDGMRLFPDGSVKYPDPQPEVTDPAVAVRLRQRQLARRRAYKRAEAKGDPNAERIAWEGSDIRCEARQSNRWPGGNAPYPGDGSVPR